jgi:hypothetical protein
MRDEHLPARAPTRSRAVLSVTPKRNGCVEIALECGHVVRRRLSLCPPSRLPCPSCARAERDRVPLAAIGPS